LQLPHRDLMAELKELEGPDAVRAPMEKPPAQLLLQQDGLLPSPPTAAVVSLTPAFSLTPTEKTMVDGLPGTWIMYNVITPEVEAMLNRAAEQQGGPWIEFVQSRNGKPLTRLKKIQCVVSNGWIRWYWYPDTKPDEWLPLTAINARLAQLLTELCGGRYILNSLVLNKYRDETDNIVAHQDKTGDLDPGSPIVTLSTGPLAREILFINQETGAEVKLTVPPRSVYAIGWETNQKWKHAVPPMEGVTGQRYGWTFRSVVSLWNRVTHAIVQRPQIGADMANWDVLLPAANPDRPELLQSYKVVQTVRLAQPGRLQPSDLEQISEEAQAAYSGSTVRKASNPKHRKPMPLGKEAQKRKRSGKGVPMKKKKKTAQPSSDDDEKGSE
jgi:alkylated DNA repair dioxygenase AlkB